MSIQKILQATAHRPWPLPKGNWSWYQEWNRLVFIHFRIDASIIAPLLPKGLQADIFDGTAWVSLVPFTMNRIRPRLLPSFPPVSDFSEVNLRTYVTDGQKSGVYFFSIEAANLLSVLLAGSISGMPYEQAHVWRSYGNDNPYTVRNKRNDTALSLTYRPGSPLMHKTPQDLWLTERYAVYLDKNDRLYRYEVHHLPWPLYTPEIQELQLSYRIGQLVVTEKDVAGVQYSPGVQVLAWRREML